MKTIALLFISAIAVACPPGTHPDGGACAYETEGPSVKPLDEKPPTDKMPSYQREGIHAVTPPSLSAQDQKLDDEKTQATFEGKVAAGLTK